MNANARRIAALARSGRFDLVSKEVSAILKYDNSYRAIVLEHHPEYFQPSEILHCANYILIQTSAEFEFAKTRDSEHELAVLEKLYNIEFKKLSNGKYTPLNEIDLLYIVLTSG